MLDGFFGVERRRGLSTAGPAEPPLYTTAYGAPGDGPRVVFCPPLGDEHGWSRGVLHRLAARLAAAGHPTIVYDPSGHGDSGAEFADLSLDSLCADLARMSTAPILVAFRFGAIVAARALARGLVRPERLVLVAPVLRGATWARDVLRRNVAAQMTLHGTPRVAAEDLRAELQRGRTIEVDGHELGPALFHEAERCDALDLLSAADVPIDVIAIRSRPTAPPPAEVIELCRRRDVALHVVDEHEFWAEYRKEIVADAPRLGERLIDLLRAAPGAAERREPVILQASEVERFVDIAYPGGTLAGVIHTPPRRSAAKAILLTPAGLRDRSGPMRLYTRLARRLSAAGHVVLRWDTAGVGESAGELPSGSKVTAYRAIQEGALGPETLAAAACLQRASGAESLVVVGLCGGAFHAAHLAREAPGLVEAVFGLGMPPCLVEEPSDGAPTLRRPSRGALRESAQRYLERARRPDAWLRLLHGRTDYGALLASLRALLPAAPRRAARAADGATARVAEAALAGLASTDGRVHRPTWEQLVRIRARGAPVMLAWGAHDDARHAYDDLLLHCAPELSTLFTRHVIAGGTHECASGGAFDAFAQLVVRFIDGISSEQPSLAAPDTGPESARLA